MKSTNIIVLDRQIDHLDKSLNHMRMTFDLMFSCLCLTAWLIRSAVISGHFCHEGRVFMHSRQILRGRRGACQWWMKCDLEQRRRERGERKRLCLPCCCRRFLRSGRPGTRWPRARAGPGHRRRRGKCHFGVLCWIPRSAHLLLKIGTCIHYERKEIPGWTVFI